MAQKDGHRQTSRSSLDRGKAFTDSLAVSSSSSIEQHLLHHLRLPEFTVLRL